MKKLISSILVLAMVLSLISGTAIFANAAEGAVAKIGDTEYTKLEDAIKAAPKNEPTTIYLLQDYKISSTMAGHQHVQNLTIDLGGHTLTSSGIALTAYRAGTTLTVQNGTVVGNSSSGSLRATYNGKLILGENLTVKGAGGGATLVYTSNGTVEIAAKNGVKFEGGKVDFKAGADGDVINVAAKIGRTYFGTLADAVAVGGEVTLLDDIQLSETIKVKGNVTLNLNGKAITGTDNATGNFALIEVQPGATLTVNGEGKIGLTATNNRNFNAYSSVISNQRGTLIINGGTIQHSGGTDMAYAIDNLTNGKGTRAETVINGGLVSSTYRAVRQFLNGVEAQNILTVNGGKVKGANRSIWMQNADANKNPGTLTVSENAKVFGDILISGSNAAEVDMTVQVAAAALAEPSTVVGSKLPEGYVVENNNGTWGVVEAPVVANVADVNGTGYETLAEAIADAQAGATITFLADITENVTISKNLTIDGAGKTFSGEMDLTNKASITIKNVNFDGKGAKARVYAVEAKGAYYITIVDCTAKNYMGLLQAANSNVLTTVKNVTVSDAVIAVKVDYANEVVLENVNLTGSAAGFLNSNWGTKTITIKNSNINILGTWDREKGLKTTYVFEGENAIGEFVDVDAKIDFFKLAAGATLTAPNDITVGTDVANGTVVYEDGKYFVQTGLAGSGTEADPYQIGSVNDLILFRDSVNAGETKYNAPGVYVALTASIDMDGATWERGIGDGINATFDGIFDGKGNTIKNLNFAPEADSDGYFCGGLFGYTYGAASIKNLVLENITVTAVGAGHNVGALVGFAYNKGGKLNVSNVTVNNVTISAPDVYGVGAIVGYSYGAMGTIENCSVSGSSITGYSFVGGITGYSYSNAVITECNVENTTIRATSMGAGGIAGIALDGNQIRNNTVKGCDVFASNETWGYVVGELSAEGVDIVVADNDAAYPQIGGNYADSEAILAKVGNKYYTTLAEAIEAAKDDETIVLMKDISVDADDLVDLDGYYTFFKVEGKSITIDLNGKTVYADASAVTGKFVVGVFSTANGGHLALTGGTVKGYSGADQTAAYLDPAKGNKDYNYKFYSLLANYNNDCSITVNGGYYELDYAGDSLAYTSCNEGIVVNGGTFKLGNLGGIRNGMPWIFNARGQNQRHVVVNGGSFNADVLHQYWIFEVEAPKELALKNENGMYTVVPAVAYVNEQHWSGKWYTRNVGYATLEEAEAAVSAEPKVKVSGGKTYVAEQEYVTVLVSSSEVIVNDEESLKAALANGGEIKLGQDIVLTEALAIAEGAEVVFDLNGKNIVANSEGYVFENAGSLTIGDSVEGGTVTGIVYTEAGAETVINGGTFNAADGASYVLLNCGTMTINGGTVNGGSSYPVYSYNEGNKLVINDVTVNATFGCINIYGLNGTGVINGGTFNMTGVAGKTSHIAYFANVDVTINGGNFNKIGDINMSGTGGGGICAIYGADVTIKGGNFAGDYADLYNWSGTNANGRAVKISVEGGNFKFNPASMVAAGYKVVQGDAGYSVVAE